MVWIEKAQALTANNTGLTLAVAVNYGGRWDIMQAARKAFVKAQQAGRSLLELTETDLDCEMTTAGLPEPDLFIRTSGEQRISNFLLWQLAYAEFVFLPEYWPEFDEASLLRAIEEFQQRERRFGQLSHQVAGQK